MFKKDELYTEPRESNSNRCLFISSIKGDPEEVLYQAIVQDGMTQEEQEQLKRDIGIFWKEREAVLKERTEQLTDL